MVRSVDIRNMEWNKDLNRCFLFHTTCIARFLVLCVDLDNDWVDCKTPLVDTNLVLTVIEHESTHPISFFV